MHDSTRLRESMEERLQFEKLLSEISSVYINLPADEVDKTIEYGLQRIGKFLGADRCNFSQIAGDHIRTLYSWADEGIERLPEFLVGTPRFFPWALDRLKKGEVVQFSDIDELPDEAAVDKKNFRKFRNISHVSVPIAVGGYIMGTFTLDAVRTRRTWPKELVLRLQLVGEVFANALVRKQKEMEILRAFSEIEKLKVQLEADNSYLREEIELTYDFQQMIGQSEALKQMLSKIGRIAVTDTTVLVLGETGTGKELVARAIHSASPRKERPMVKVNCAALPANLIESELFGHERGAFTSAQARQVGRFELANNGTLFLDEIGELSLESQAKLLRVLQEGEFERLGSSRTVKVDVRIIAATNRDLEGEVKNGRFRKDLWYRLNVFPIIVPPLRQRREDIPLLVTWFVDKFSRKMGKTIKRIPTAMMNDLANHHWPGNVRELENVIERAVITTQGSHMQLLDKLDVSHDTGVTARQVSTLAEVEHNHIINVLEETKWKINGPRGAATLLDLNPSTLRFRMKKLGIKRSPTPE